MSFGYGVNDIVGLIQLSWSAVEGATRACGKSDDLTKELSSLYDVLAHLYSELSVSESSIGYSRTSSKAELQDYLAGCDKQLRIINTVLDKFNGLNPGQKAGRQLWSKVRFANGEDQDVIEIRASIATYSTAIAMSLRLMSLGSRGKFERQLNRQKGSLQGIRKSVNLALARINSSMQQKSLILAHSNDSKAFWSRLRRDLAKDGFSRSALNDKKDLIISYMKELHSRGVLRYSTSYQKAMNDKQEVRRQSNTPASFQGSPILTTGRNSKSSLQSFDRKDSGYCSAASDDRTSSNDQSWPDSRPIAAVEYGEDYDDVPDLAQYEQGIESPSQHILCREPVEPNLMIGPKTSTEPSFGMSDQQPLLQSPSHHGLPQSFSRYTMRNEGEQKIKLEDPHGREFSFPLSQAKSWEGMEILIKKNCAGIGCEIVNADHYGENLLPSLWEEMAEPGAKLTIRRPCARLSQPSVFCPPSEEFCFLPERPVSPQQEDSSYLPTLGDWMKRGITEFTPHSEFYEVE